MTQRRVLITGATGGVGTVLSNHLVDTYDIVRHGLHATGPEEEATVQAADLSDYAAVLSLMDGIDVVVHLAGAASPDAEWADVAQANLLGFRNVLEAARQAGVRRFVFASSNHVTGMYDRHEQWPIHPGQLPRADSLYGVSKVFGEALGRFYHDEYGIEFIALRIGWMAEDPTSTDVELLHAMWLSIRDTVQVVRRAIEADVPYGVYYATSANPNRRWDITNTMLELGYRPQDAWSEDGDHPPVPGGEPAPDDWPHNS